MRRKLPLTIGTSNYKKIVKNIIYKIEKQLAKLSFAERYTKRLEQEKPLLDELFEWAKKLKCCTKICIGKSFDLSGKPKAIPYELS